MTLSPFHLAIPVYDLAAARAFYGEAFGCAEGRSSEHWVDFDFFGHQISLHLGRPFATTNTGSSRRRRSRLNAPGPATRHTAPATTAIAVAASVNGPNTL